MVYHGMRMSWCLNSLTQVVKEEMLEQIKKDILLPTINGMRAEGKPFIGCLFAGGWFVGIECSTSGFSAFSSLSDCARVLTIVHVVRQYFDCSRQLPF